MPITVEIDDCLDERIFDDVFAYFNYVDEKFSPFKSSSELTKINSGQVSKENYSSDMQTIFALAEETKKITVGYFDITARDGKINPSGLVKGWSIYNAAKIIENKGIKDFYVEAGGDIQARGKTWKIGIKNPFEQKKIVKVLKLKDMGIATSGTYIRGQHIYNPFEKEKNITEIVSLTVIGPNVYEADRFATAAFAMGRDGINFIEKLEGFEGYMIDSDGQATMTTNFEKYVAE